MLSFEHPFAFLLILLIPLYFVARKIGFLQTFSFPQILSDWNGNHFGWKNKTFSFFRLCSKILFFIAYTFFIIALASPLVHHQEKVFVSKGAEIFFVLDTSPSMAALDIAGGTRLDAARTAITTLIKQNPGADYGLVAMGSQAAVLVPATGDKNYFFERMAAIKIAELGDGSAIGTGISSAVYHLSHSDSPKRCIVLITDGENNAGSVHPNTAARLAKENGIILYVLGLGTSGSVPLEYIDPKTAKLVSGSFTSSFDSMSLVKLASIADGAYFSAENATELSAALDTVARLESVSQKFFLKSTDKKYFREFLFIAMLCFAFAWVIKRILLREFL